jgi:hypothetical protein
LAEAVARNNHPRAAFEQVLGDGRQDPFQVIFAESLAIVIQRLLQGGELRHVPLHIRPGALIELLEKIQLRGGELAHGYFGPIAEAQLLLQQRQLGKCRQHRLNMGPVNGELHGILLPGIGAPSFEGACRDRIARLIPPEYAL